MSKATTAFIWSDFFQGKMSIRRQSRRRLARASPQRNPVRGVSNAPLVANSPVERADIQATDFPMGPFSFSDANSPILEQLMRVRGGYDFIDLDKLASRLEIDLDDLCTLVGIPKESRDASTKRSKLSPIISDRLYRIESVFELAISVLESETGTVAWLNSPIPALRNEIPLSMLDTDLGTKLVRDVLLRLEYGMVS